MTGLDRRFDPRLARATLAATALSAVLLQPARSTAAEPADSAPAERVRFLSPKQIYETLEASPLEYEVKSIQREALPADVPSQYWHAARARLDYPVVRRTARGPSVEAYVVKPAVEEALQRGEELYRKGQLDEADALYAKAAALDPGYGQPLLFRGDCAFGKREFAAALAFYDKAIALNPMDHSGYVFKADALVHLGRLAEAREMLATALVLSPRNENVLQMLRRLAAPFKVNVQPELLSPQALVQKIDGGYGVSVVDGPGEAHWGAWGMCKAMWLGEESHRKELVGSTARGFSVVEEVECLAALLSMYEQGRENSGADSFLDRLLAISYDGLAGAFVVYELGARVDPHLTLTMSEEARAALKRYVLKYVLSAGELPAPAAATASAAATGPAASPAASPAPSPADASPAR